MIFLLIFTFSCSQKKEGGNEAVPESIGTVDVLNPIIEQRVASNDVFEYVISGLKYSNGKPLDGLSFTVFSDDANVEFYNYEGEELVKRTEVQVVVSGGELRFLAKLPPQKDLYKILYRFKGLDRIGIVYFNVQESQITSFTRIQTSYFQDDPPYNQVKDQNEVFAFLANSENQVTVGPIVDEFGNRTSGTMEVSLERVRFLDNTTSRIISFQDGYAYFDIYAPSNVTSSVINLKIAQENREEVFESFLNSFPVMAQNLEVNTVNDLGGIMAGESVSSIVYFQNTGQSTINDLAYSIGSPFSIVQSTCDTILEPREECSFTVSFTSELSGEFSGNLFITGVTGNERLEQFINFSVNNFDRPRIEIINSFVFFENTAVGTSVTKKVKLRNSGGLPITDLSFSEFTSSNPNIPFYFNAVRNNTDCPLPIQPGSVCELDIVFSPTGIITNADTVFFKISGPDILEDKSVFIRATSFVDNFADDIDIVLSKTNILKDNVDKINIEIGPLRRNDGSIATGEEVRIYLKQNQNNNLVNVGRFDSAQVVVSSNEAYITARTNFEGKIIGDFSTTPSDQKIGGVSLVVSKVDSLGNILANGTSSFTIDGARLTTDVETVSFLKAYTGLIYKQDVLITNEGTIPASNISFSLAEDSRFAIEDFNCEGLNQGILNLAPSSSCTFKVNFVPEAGRDFVELLDIETISIGENARMSLIARGVQSAKILSSLFSINEDFPHEEAFIEKELLLTNISDETILNFDIDLQFDEGVIVSNNCPSSLSKLESCRITYRYTPAPILTERYIYDTILYSGQGNESFLSLSQKTDVTIQHSSMIMSRYKDYLVEGVCTQLFKVSLDEATSEDVIVSIQNDNINFYSDNNCQNSVTQTIISNGQTSSSDVYALIEPFVQREEVITLNAPNFAVAENKLPIYKKLNRLDIVRGAGQVNIANIVQGDVLPFTLRAVDEDEFISPETDVDFILLNKINKSNNLIPNHTLRWASFEEAFHEDTKRVSFTKDLRFERFYLDMPSNHTFISKAPTTLLANQSYFIHLNTNSIDEANIILLEIMDDSSNETLESIIVSTDKFLMKEIQYSENKSVKIRITSDSNNYKSIQIYEVGLFLKPTPMGDMSNLSFLMRTTNEEGLVFNAFNLNNISTGIYVIESRNGSVVSYPSIEFYENDVSCGGSYENNCYRPEYSGYSRILTDNGRILNRDYLNGILVWNINNNTLLSASGQDANSSLPYSRRGEVFNRQTNSDVASSYYSTGRYCTTFDAIRQQRECNRWGQDWSSIISGSDTYYCTSYCPGEINYANGGTCTNPYNWWAHCCDRYFYTSPKSCVLERISY